MFPQQCQHNRAVPISASISPRCLRGSVPVTGEQERRDPRKGTYESKSNHNPEGREKPWDLELWRGLSFPLCCSSDPLGVT